MTIRCSSSLPRLPLAAALALALLLPLTAEAADWTHWRGPFQNGMAGEGATGLVASWSEEGENLAWRGELTGRSTPVVFDGRACANGRAGEGIERQETVICWDALTGEKLWEHRFPVYNTTVPWNRVGWANLAADPETGNVYAQGVAGTFLALGPEGEVVWERSLDEELGFFSGYGGRTQTPIVDEDRVIVTFVSSSWGPEAPPRHRTHAFDKRTGDLLWVASPGEFPEDMNSQSTPALAVVDGRRMLIQGNGDGWVYAIDARTGESLWKFHLSQRALNTSPLVDGNTVYVSHSEENVDGGPMGRVVAIDATGSGDVTATHERWRAPIAAGFSSPSLAKVGDTPLLLVTDNSANLHALDLETGEELWDHSLGTVGKASPVVADGKIYATEVNGHFHILQLGEDGVTVLDTDEISMPDGRYAEVYGSPAVAYGRVYFTTENGIFALGPKAGAGGGDGETTGGAPPWERLVDGGPQPPAPAGAEAATLQVIPALVRIGPGETASFSLRAFDARGHALPDWKPGAEARWALQGLEGTIENGTLKPSGEGRQIGAVQAQVGGLTAVARVRVIPPPPFTETFDEVPVGSRPDYFVAATSRFEVAELEGEKVLAKGPSPQSIHKHQTYLGPPDWKGYTIQADVLATRSQRRAADVGLVNAGYTMDLMGAHQKIQVRSWASELRMAEDFPFEWEGDTWYTIQLRVDQEADGALIRGKVWKRGEAEPEAWTVTVRDPHPVPSGSPGLYGFTPTPAYYDNVEVKENR